MYSGLTKSPVDKIPHDDSLSPIVNVLSKSVTTWIELSPQYLILLVILSLQIIINTSNIIIISYHEKIGHKKNDIINEKQFNGEKNNYFTDIIKTKDDNIAISGYTDSKINDKEYGQEDGWILKLNKNKEIIWQQIYGTELKDQFNAIIENLNGDFTVVGFSETEDNSQDGIIVRFDSTGNVLASQQLKGDKSDLFEDLLEDQNGIIYVVGSTRSSNLNSTPAQGKDSLFVKYEMYFAVEKEENENAVISTDKENAKPGKTITIKVDLEEGYKVDTIKVIDENGNEIVPGVNNTFIMPNSNVKIIVETSKIIDQIKNPETTDFITIFFALFIISCLSFLLYIKKKEN